MSESDEGKGAKFFRRNIYSRMGEIVVPLYQRTEFAPREPNKPQAPKESPASSKDNSSQNVKKE